MTFLKTKGSVHHLNKRPHQYLIKYEISVLEKPKQSGIISLPNKTYHELIVPFESKQQEMYDLIREEMCYPY